MQPTTLEAEGQQGSVPLAEAVEAYARAQRGASSKAEPSERSVSFAGDRKPQEQPWTLLDPALPFACLAANVAAVPSSASCDTLGCMLDSTAVSVGRAGADAATSAAQSELDPSDFAAAPALAQQRTSRQVVG